MLYQSALAQVSTWADSGHVLTCIGQYRHQVPGAEFGLGVRWRRVLTSTEVQERPLGISLVVVLNLECGVVPWGLPVAGQLSGTLMCTCDPFIRGQKVSRWSPTRASNIHPQGPHLTATWD